MSSDTPIATGMFRRYVSDPQNNGSYVLNLGQAWTERLFKDVDDLERSNNALLAKVGELERLIGDPHAMHAHYLRIGNGWEVWTHERVRGMERQIAELEQDKARLEKELQK